ncbi:MAG: hypothetical protein EA396_11025 [Anaerolineaceae bacterium]|nr:MAG: hypothetical protein EA396_11025 [Anaerolineaceae bacterium]
MLKQNLFRLSLVFSVFLLMMAAFSVSALPSENGGEVEPTPEINGDRPTEPIVTETPEPEMMAVCERQYPILGQIMVTGDLEGYGQPGQDRISGLNVFNDANNDGFDTFDILVIEEDEDGLPTWYGVFLGGCDPVFVDAALVTRIR